MSDRQTSGLSRRERQVLDVLHRRGEATAAEVLSDLPDAPTDSAVRSVLRILGEKGLITRRADGPRYVYAPAQAPAAAGRTALEHVVRTYFAGSPEQAVSALLGISEPSLSDAAVARLRDAIRRARDGER